MASKPRKKAPTKGRSTSAKTKSTADQQQNLLVRDVIGIAYIAVGFLLLMYVFVSFKGSLGDFTNKLIFGMCGWIAYLIPFAMAAYGILIIAGKSELKAKGSIWFCTLLVSLLTLSHIVFGQDQHMPYVSYLAAAYEYGGNTPHLGGGVIGAAICYPIQSIIGTVGCYVASITMILCSLLMVTRTSIRDISYKVKKVRKPVPRQQTFEEDEGVRRRRPFRIYSAESVDNMEKADNVDDVDSVDKRQRKAKKAHQEGEDEDFTLINGGNMATGAEDEPIGRRSRRSRRIPQEEPDDYAAFKETADRIGEESKRISRGESVRKVKDLTGAGADDLSILSNEVLPSRPKRSMSKSSARAEQVQPPTEQRPAAPKKTAVRRDANEPELPESFDDYPMRRTRKMYTVTPSSAPAPFGDELDIISDSHRGKFDKYSVSKERPSKAQPGPAAAAAQTSDKLPSFPKTDTDSPKAEPQVPSFEDSPSEQAPALFESTESARPAVREPAPETDLPDYKSTAGPDRLHSDGSRKDSAGNAAVGTTSPSHSPVPSAVSASNAEAPYTPPPLSLLKSPGKGGTYGDQDPRAVGETLIETLRSFNIECELLGYTVGPVITRFEVRPAPGVRVSRITALSNDIALALEAPRVRIEAPIPGKAAVGIEIPNKHSVMVVLRDIIESDEFRNSKSPITMAMGKDAGGNIICADLAKMPHMLIAGSTGSGKSVCINDLILSMIYKSSPEELKMILIDPKVVELSVYSTLPHLLIPVVTEPKKASAALRWAVNEMTLRYKKFSEKGARDLARYNELVEDPKQRFAKLVVIIDELADLMMVAPDEVEDSICRIAQLGRASGIHLIVATQRPSADIITGLIKANIPSRCAFAVSSGIDSRIILDETGAEKLLGRGDMLFHPNGTNKPIRCQAAFVSDGEVEKIADHFRNCNQAPVFDDQVLQDLLNAGKGGATGGAFGEGKQEDDLLGEAVRVVLESGQASISMIQRRLRVGYARAARLVDIMEQHGYVSGFDGSKPRKVLIKRAQFEQIFGDGGPAEDEPLPEEDDYVPEEPPVEDEL